MDSANNTFMVVLEPATGFPPAGRVLVTGDHNMFTNSLIGNADNTRLANNIAQWACHGAAAVEPATWGQVKSVFARQAIASHQPASRPASGSARLQRGPVE